MTDKFQHFFLPTVRTSWVAPLFGQTKLNYDASIFYAVNSAGFGFGYVLRDHFENWIKGCAGSIPMWSVCRSEIFVIWRGLVLTWECDLKSIVCENDSRYVFLAIQQPLSAAHGDSTDLLMKIHYLLNRKWVVHFNLVVREANFIADCLSILRAPDNNKYLEWLQP
ncbi:hypothetical protein S245_055411 [Arachis hypogaea]|nr:Putative ribonuclease H protein [Arachis hypogaea]